VPGSNKTIRPIVRYLLPDPSRYPRDPFHVSTFMVKSTLYNSYTILPMLSTAIRQNWRLLAICCPLCPHRLSIFGRRSSNPSFHMCAKTLHHAPLGAFSVEDRGQPLSVPVTRYPRVGIISLRRPGSYNRPKVAVLIRNRHRFCRSNDID